MHTQSQFNNENKRKLPKKLTVNKRKLKMTVKSKLDLIKKHKLRKRTKIEKKYKKEQM